MKFIAIFFYDIITKIKCKKYIKLYKMKFDENILEQFI